MLSPVIIDEGDQKYDFYTMNRDLDKAKSGVFMGKNAAFFGSLMCTLNFVWASGVETAATDGQSFFWDPDDFFRCDLEERKSTIMHELWHVARLHNLRRGERCGEIWNLACDIMINRELKQMGYFIGSTWLMRPDLDHLQTEEDIYDFLISPGGGGMKPGQKPGHGQGGHCQHGQVPVSPAQKQAMVNSTVKAIQQAKMSKQAGSIPGGVEQIVNKFLAPKIPWEAVVYQWFTDLLENDYTWARPNRRHTEMYLPSPYEDEGRLAHLCYYLDVSGSISDKEVLRFNSEVKYIKDTFNPKKLTLVLFDTKIQKVIEFTEDDPFDEVVVVGRGGTDLTEVRDHIMKHQPTAAIVFSDLYVTPMAEGPVCPILWIVVNNKDAVVPFGKMIHIKE